MQFFDWSGEGWVRSSQGTENVLVLLKLGRNVYRDVAALFKRQVLCFVEEAEVIDHGFKLIAEVSFVDVLVGAQVTLGGAVLDQDWVRGTHRLSLSFKSGVRVATFNHPLVVIAFHGVHADFLEAGHWRI